MRNDTDLTDLVARARGGEAWACAELIRRFQGAVYAAVLRRLPDRTEAEDVAQEVFLHGFRKLAQLRDPRCFGGWLRRTAIRLAVNRATRLRVGRRFEEGQAGAATAPGPLEVLLQAERRAAVWHGLRRLRPVDRQTLLAFYFQGQSVQEMARLSDVSVGTIKSRLYTARTRLGEQLGPLAVAG
jgi:RNA polymerase sigma-70 factor (ECF subfamily)